MVDNEAVYICIWPLNPRNPTLTMRAIFRRHRYSNLVLGLSSDISIAGAPKNEQPFVVEKTLSSKCTKKIGLDCPSFLLIATKDVLYTVHK